MMNVRFHNTCTVAAYNVKLLFRSWTFRFFLLLVLCVVVNYQMLVQTGIFFGVNSGLVTLASYFPHQNAYLYIILQVVPLVFLTGTFVGKDRKLDSMDTIYYRPESNAEYVGGIFGAFVVAFSVMAWVSLGGAMLLNLFGSDSPFDVWIYFFYWITMILPALVFTLGVSFFIYAWVRHRGLSMLLLLVIFGTFIFKLSGARQGLFDPLGLLLPNAFSAVEGHPGMVSYLVQRLCWLFVGLGFVGLAALVFQRLPNRPGNRRLMMGISVTCFLVGVVLGGYLYMARASDMDTRRYYAGIYDKYREMPKGMMVANSLEVEQRGKVLTAKSTLVVRNEGREALPEVLLYLNPALEVSAVSEGTREVAHERDGQVVRVAREVSPGEEVELRVEYAGGIDERVCYLDVPEDRLFEIRPFADHSCAAGHQFAYLDDRFTVLTPECLWYPVCRPPVNPASPYDVLPDFTTYTLRVVSPGDRVVIAPGRREEGAGDVCFTNERPLPGVALCMGRYERRELLVDSTMYELYFFEGHGDVLDQLEIIEDSIPGVIRDARYIIEQKMGVSYPYTRLRLVESPVSFAGFSRPNKGGSEMAQPEMIFMPERGVGRWQDFKSELDSWLKNFARSSGFQQSIEEMFCQTLTSHFYSMFLSDYNFSVNQARQLLFYLLSYSDAGGGGLPARGNVYTIAPMFYEQAVAVRSDDYPAINKILAGMLRQTNNYSMSNDENGVEKMFGGRGVADVFQGRIDNPVEAAAYLHEKTQELLRLLSVRGIPVERIVEFLAGYIRDNRFRQVDFDELNQAFIREFKVDWMEVLPTWYENRELPVFFLRDFRTERVKMVQANGDDDRSVHGVNGGGWTLQELQNGCVRVSINVFNDSDVDGVVSFETRSMRYGNGGPRRVAGGREGVTVRNFLIKARTGKQISAVMPGGTVKFKANISRNLPRELFDYGMNSNMTTDTTERVKDLDRSYFFAGPDEVIVDNEDEEFRLINPSSRKRLRDILMPLEEKKYELNNTLALREGSEVVPRHMISAEAYGLNRLTHAFMMPGSGASMEWTARVDREGEYEVYAFLPPKVNTHRISRASERAAMLESVVVFDASSQAVSEAKQYYVIVGGEERHEVVADVEEKQGWVLLGRFRLPAGECKVVLTDRGMEEQVLLGDAIKWVYVGT